MKKHIIMILGNDDNPYGWMPEEEYNTFMENRKVWCIKAPYLICLLLFCCALFVIVCI